MAAAPPSCRAAVNGTPFARSALVTWKLPLPTTPKACPTPRPARTDPTTLTTLSSISPRLEDDALLAHGGDRGAVVTEFGEDLVGVLAQQRGARDIRLERGELDRAADGEERAAALLLHLHDRAAAAQVLVVG